MAQPPAADIPKLTSELANQAALRAQKLLNRQSSSEEFKKVPAIPARTTDRPPPEIPPKRHSLKKIPPEGVTAVPMRIPPPLPQKPSSAQNSPQFAVKLRETVVPQGSPPMPPRPVSSVAKFNAPRSTPVSTNNSPQLPLRKNIPTKKISPSEDFGSEDALRGIESGLRNMERAMEEQIKAAAAAAAAEEINMNFNQPRGLERNLSMDQMLLENFAGNLRSMESNPNIRKTFEEIKQQQQQRNIVAPAPDNHMRSLDRNLPLELQYTRHRQQQQQQQLEQSNNSVIPLSGDFREHIRQQLMSGGSVTVVPNASINNVPVSPAAAALLQHQSQSRQAAAVAAAAAAAVAAREDMRLRRRSSHDEAQMTQAGIPGEYFIWFFDFSLFVSWSVCVLVGCGQLFRSSLKRGCCRAAIVGLQFF